MKQFNIFRFHFYTYRFFYGFFLLGFIVFGIIGYLWFDLHQTSQITQDNIEYYYISLFTLLLLLHLSTSLYESIYVSKYYLQVHIHRKDYIISSLTHMLLLSFVTILLLVGLNVFLLNFTGITSPIQIMVVRHFIPSHVLWFLLFFFLDIFVTLLVSVLKHMKKWLLIVSLLLLLGAFTYVEIIEHMYKEFILYLIHTSFSVWMFILLILAVLIGILIYILRFRKIAIYYY